MKYNSRLTFSEWKVLNLIMDFLKSIISFRHFGFDLANFSGEAFSCDAATFLRRPLRKRHLPRHTSKQGNGFYRAHLLS